MKFDKFGKLGQLKMPDLKNSVGKLKERWKSQPGKTKKLVAAIGGGILCTAVLMAVVVGNSTELKNVIIFNSVQVPHYNYVGDSILGYKSHMGAGSITSNVKSDKTLVVVKDVYDTKEEIETGRKKFGAMLGDHVEVGCNSVLNPGTVIGRNSNIYPLSRVRGVIPANHIFKDKDNVVLKK